MEYYYEVLVESKMSNSLKHVITFQVFSSNDSVHEFLELRVKDKSRSVIGYSVYKCIDTASGECSRKLMAAEMVDGENLKLWDKTIKEIKKGKEINKFDIMDLEKDE